MRRLAEADASYPPILLFHQGTVAEGDAFFSERWPGARAVSDPGRRFYRGLGLERGSIGQVLGPAVVACGLRAAAKGHVLGKIVGDPMQMPGLFWVRGGEVLWHHDFRHAGDHPDFSALPALLAEQGASS